MDWGIRMNGAEMIEQCREHTIYTWAAGAETRPLPIVRSEGVYFWTADGKRWLDWNSSAMSVNVGHSHPTVIAAMKAQLDELPFAVAASATKVRARLGGLLSSITPPSITKFLFSQSGAEANENAIKAARWYTGRTKIISRYRSYHGATNACMQATGDPRRWALEPGAPGFIRVMDPEPYSYAFGRTDAERTERNIKYLREILLMEGTHNIAALMMETVTGTNGVLVPPAGYLPAVRALCDEIGAMLIFDEVMVGFGRTGKMFAFEHFDVVPDILTMAKGLASCYAPIGATGFSEAIAEHFEDHVFRGGHTYNSHPLGLAAAEAAVGVLQDEKLPENSARMGKILAAELQRLADNHRCVKTFRSLGLFAMVDLQSDTDGTPAAGYNATSPMMVALGDAFQAEGLYAYRHWDSFMCCPPLCINEVQLRDGLAIIDRALTAADALVQG